MDFVAPASAVTNSAVPTRAVGANAESAWRQSHAGIARSWHLWFRDERRRFRLLRGVAAASADCASKSVPPRGRRTDANAIRQNQARAACFRLGRRNGFYDRYAGAGRRSRRPHALKSCTVLDFCRFAERSGHGLHRQGKGNGSLGQQGSGMRALHARCRRCDTGPRCGDWR